MERIKYSVILPTYLTPAALLYRSIKSALAVPRTDLEVLLVEAIPPEGNRSLDPIRVDDQRVRIFYSDFPSAPRQRNIALDNCKGEFVVFLDSDDFLSPTFFDVADDIILDYPDSDIWIFNHTSGSFPHQEYCKKDVQVADSPTLIAHWFNTASKSRPSFMEKSIWGKVYRRSVIESIRLRFDLRLKSTQDHFFNLRLIKHVNSVAYDPNYYAYHYEFSPSSMTKTIVVASPERFQTLIDAWDRLFLDYPPSEDDLKNRAYNFSLIFLPTMVRDYFTNPRNTAPRSKRLRDWKRIAKQSEYLRAISQIRYADCPNKRKRLFLFLMRTRLYGVVFRLYEKQAS